MDVRLPDGTIIKNVPDGTTKSDLVQKLQRNGVAVPAEWLGDAPKQQASQAAGSALKDIPRQLGLTARYAVEGLGQAADVVTEPIRQMVVNQLARATGLPQATQSTGQLASSAADSMGLPSPQTPDERVIGDASRLVAGAGGIAGASGAAGRATSGITSKVLAGMAKGPGQQAIAAAGSGLAGGSVREAGGGPLAQFGASLVGGVAAPLAANALQSVGRRAVNALTPESVRLADADAQIRLVMQRQGVNWDEVAPGIKNQLRREAADALSSGGELDGDALRRLMTFKNVPGTTPTRGMLTQDPVQITRERNLAKVGANSSDIGLQKLPGLENENVSALLRNLDDAGASGAPSAYGAGEKVINSLQMRRDAAKGRIDSLYEAARSESGRDLPMNPGAFTSRANTLIDEAMVGGALPEGVAKTMNKIAVGEMPFTVDVAEQFKTRIGKLQRATNDGQARYALGLVRQALDETPVVGTESVNPGNLPAIPGQVPPSVAGAAESALGAFASARKANAQWMSRVEANPALKAVVDGVEPDQFVSKFIINKGATAKDLRNLSDEVGPEATTAIRQYIVKHLRDAATSNTDDINKFSNQSYRNALKNLGDEKLAAFFDKEDIQRLKDIGDAGKYMQAQPAGTAVNNSNSGALIAGRAMDLLDQIAGKVPFGDVLVQGNIRGLQQRQALKVPNALAQPVQRQALPVNALMVPLIYGAGQSQQGQP